MPGSNTLATASGGIPAEVRAIIAEITRYPLDILEPTADIEEELGIDSVKLGEILSVLRERFHLPPAAELRARFPATQLRTIGGISEAVVALAGGGTGLAAPPPSPGAAFSPSPAAHAEPAGTAAHNGSRSAAVAATSLVNEVRQVFAELTRYPLDILSA